MNIRKCIVGYFTISIIFPAIFYLASIKGNDMIKELATVLFFPIAIIIFFYSIGVIGYVFGKREHEILDRGFVLRINLIIILAYIIRYIAVYMVNISEVPNFLIQFIITPFGLLFISPLIKNYCLNKKTVIVTLIISIVVIYIIMPLLFGFIEDLCGEKSIYLTNIFNKYFIYESVSNNWTRVALDMLDMNFSDSRMLVILNFSKFIMFCIVFLPYLVINFVLIDELSYKEKCIDVSMKKTVYAVLIMTICLVVCVELSNLGEIELIYTIKH